MQIDLRMSGKIVAYHLCQQIPLRNLDEVRDYATQWMWRYNHERPNMGLGGISPKQRLAMAAWLYFSELGRITDRDAVSELSGKAGERSFPIPDGHAPLLTEVVQCQIEPLSQHIITGKSAPVLAQLLQAHIDRLNGFGDVNDLADFR